MDSNLPFTECVYERKAIYYVCAIFIGKKLPTHSTKKNKKKTSRFCAHPHPDSDPTKRSILFF